MLLLIAPLGCTLLRSTPLPPEEWAFVTFPDDSSRAGPLLSVTSTALIAAGCAAPDTVTFALEARCDVADRSFGRHALIVSNWTRSGYRPDVLRAIMSQAEGRHRFAAQAAALAREGRYEGMLLDLRLSGPRDVDAFVRLVTAVADSARASGVSPVGIVVPIADTAAYPGRHLGAVTDFLAASLELDPATPGPLTPRDRMSGFIGARAAEMGAHRLMLLLPADGYLWAAGGGRRRISFLEALDTARDWGVELTRDETSATLRARAPGRGEIWVNDATLIAGIVRDARRLGVRKFALYRLGGEDPAVWSVIEGRPITR